MLQCIHNEAKDEEERRKYKEISFSIQVEEEINDEWEEVDYSLLDELSPKRKIACTVFTFNVQEKLLSDVIQINNEYYFPTKSIKIDNNKLSVEMISEKGKDIILTRTIDFVILKEFREDGFVEKICANSYEDLFNYYL